MASPVFAANPTLVQRRGKKGKFELVVADANGSALYNLTRDNGGSNGYPWTLTETFALDIRLVGGISLIEGPFNNPGNLEVVINGGGRLLHFNNNPNGNWSGQDSVTDAPVIGVPAFYQTKSG